MKIAILGAGTWGVALSSVLRKNGEEVALWSAISEEISELKRSSGHKNLPGVILPSGIEYTDKIEEAIRRAEMIIFVTPSKFIRATAERAAPYIEQGAMLVSAAKGIESGTLMTMTEIIEDVTRVKRSDLSYTVAALSGPTHAE